jgi:hypothetical protein
LSTCAATSTSLGQDGHEEVRALPVLAAGLGIAGDHGVHALGLQELDLPAGVYVAAPEDDGRGPLLDRRAEPVALSVVQLGQRRDERLLAVDALADAIAVLGAADGQ